MAPSNTALAALREKHRRQRVASASTGTTAAVPVRQPALAASAQAAETTSVQRSQPKRPAPFATCGTLSASTPSSPFEFLDDIPSDSLAFSAVSNLRSLLPFATDSSSDGDSEPEHTESEKQLSSTIKPEKKQNLDDCIWELPKVAQYPKRTFREFSSASENKGPTDANSRLFSALVRKKSTLSDTTTSVDAKIDEENLSDRKRTKISADTQRKPAISHEIAPLPETRAHNSILSEQKADNQILSIEKPGVRKF
ncbi:hypothetical protein HDU83_004456 [Entophlyctis luteolus]|nr:hypothetical protein HDU83_004456 [Entophlyctis luteolus]